MLSFVLLFPGRCGGTWLFTIIGSSSYVHIHEERIGNSYDKKVQDQYGEEIGDVVQERIMREFLFKSRYTKATSFGFSVQMRNLRNIKALRNLLKEEKAKIINLTRRNRVKHALSFLSSDELLKSTGIYHVINGDPVYGKRMGTFSPDPVRLLEKARELDLLVQKQRSFIHDLSLKTLPIVYEDMVADISVIADKVYDFLELPDRESARLDKLVKNMDDDLRNALSNYDEVFSAFKGTEFEHCFK